MTQGRTRYAEAMALYQQGRLSAHELERYRIASARNDAPPPAAQSPETGIRTLIDEADIYLSTLPGPGVAEVRARLNHWRRGPVTTSQSANPVLQTHLPAALTQLHPAQPALAEAIANAARHLDWTTYDAYDAAIGPDFPHNHCYASLIGDGATIPAQDFDFGLFLIAPHMLYRDHHHAAPELYAPLTGPHGWRFAPNRPLIVKQAHQPVWNGPHQPHLTKVGSIPFLAFFARTRDIQSRAQVLQATDWPELEALHLG